MAQGLLQLPFRAQEVRENPGGRPGLSLIDRTVSVVVIKPTLNDAGAVIHGDDERCKRHRACGRYSNSP